MPNANEKLNAEDPDVARKWEDLMKKAGAVSQEDTESAFSRNPAEPIHVDFTSKKELSIKETNAVVMAIDAGTLTPSEVPKEIRMSMVRTLAGMGQKTTTIARALGVSRRTIGSDLKEIYSETGRELYDRPTDAVAGEIYFTFQSLMDLAIKDGLIKTAGTLYKDMIQLLQSVGAIPQKPKQIRAAIMHGTMDSACRAYTTYMDRIGQDKPQVEFVLRELIECVQTGQQVLPAPPIKQEIKS